MSCISKNRNLKRKDNLVMVFRYFNCSNALMNALAHSSTNNTYLLFPMYKTASYWNEKYNFKISQTEQHLTLT